MSVRVGQPTLLDRISDKFTVSDDCWEWTGSRVPDGYGIAYIGELGSSRSAHRIIYELLVGPIPKGDHLDHLCRNRGCVRPDHLEPVSCRENILRGEGVASINAAKTHCKRGHLFDDENTYLMPGGGRQCRVCRRQHSKNHRQRGAAA